MKSRLHRAFQLAIRRFSLIEEGDHVLVGLSGGKDSLCLLEFLGEAVRNSGGRFRVSALHVRMEGVDYASDATYLQEMAEAAGIPLYIRTATFETDRKERRTPCFLCSWQRRKTLFSVAQELGCDKIALGHHQDDILRTALMNLTFSGSFSTMPALLRLRKMPLTIIRPLCMVHEDDIKEWAALRGYKPLEKHCPHEKQTNRTHIVSAFETMQSLNPDFRNSLWHALVKEGKMVEGDSLYASE